MKKNNLLRIIAALILSIGITFAFSSCTKISKDENGFCLDGESAVKTAKKEQKNILIIATMKGDDLFSNDLIEFVLKDSRFNEEIGKDYTVLLMDFSQSSYKATVYNEESTKEEIKAAEENAKRMHGNTFIASRLGAQLTPALYIMSEDMYYITELDFTTDQITNYDSFKSLLDSAKPVIDQFKAKTDAIKGSKSEKLAAMDALYESVDVHHKPFFIGLVNDYIKLDKRNESGLLSKYIFEKAEIEGANFFNGGDIGNAVKTYVDTAKDLRLSPEYRQNCYYLAAYILIMSNSTDISSIVEYLQAAIDAYPEGPETPAIIQSLEHIKSYFAPMLGESSGSEE